MTKEFAEGWLAVIDIIAKLLEAGHVPTASRLVELTSKKPNKYCIAPKAASLFLKQGGRQVTPDPKCEHDASGIDSGILHLGCQV